MKRIGLFAILVAGAGAYADAQPPAPVFDLVPVIEIPDDAAIAKLTEFGVKFAADKVPTRKVFLGRVDPGKVGKKLPKNKVVQLANYVGKFAAPPSYDLSPKAMLSIQRMYRNDAKGCCVISSDWHRVGTWSGNDGPAPITVPDSRIDQDYAKLAYQPGTDSGCIISDVLQYRVTHGHDLPDGTTSKLDGFAEVDNGNKELVKTWISTFGGGPIGINLPRGWGGSNGSTWDAPTGGNTTVVGGHDVHVFGYNETGVLISTWGGTRTITWRAFLKKPGNWNDWGISEAWCPLSPLWYGADNLTPNGIKVEKMRAALKELKDKGTITIDPNDPPPPPPPPPPPVGKGYTVTYTYTEDGRLAGPPVTAPLGTKVNEEEVKKRIEDLFQEKFGKGVQTVGAVDIQALIKAIMEIWKAFQMAESVGTAPTDRTGPVVGVTFTPGRPDTLVVRLADGSPETPLAVAPGAKPILNGKPVAARQLLSALIDTPNVRYSGATGRFTTFVRAEDIPPPQQVGNGELHDHGFGILADSRYGPLWKRDFWNEKPLPALKP